jgi:hypothetical protein
MMKNYDLIAFQLAASNLRPGLVDYIEETYESIRWRTENIPSEKEVLAEASRVKTELAFEDFRSERNKRLLDSDWTQTPDAPVDAKAWAKYRQQLRDMPETITDPTQPITWPTPPE